MEWGQGRDWADRQTGRQTPAAGRLGEKAKGRQVINHQKEQGRQKAGITHPASLPKEGRREKLGQQACLPAIIYLLYWK